MRIADRYVAKEFLGPFLFCLFGFVVILISGTLFELADLIIVKKVAVSAVGSMLVYKLPSVVVDALPAAVLFATLLSLSRLAKDSELTVMRMAGVRFGRIIVPMVVVAALASVADFYVSDRVVPQANHRFEDKVRLLVFEDPLPQVQQDVFFRSRNQYFYVRKITRGSSRVEGVMVYETLPEGFPRIVTAKDAIISGATWTLNQVVIHELDGEGFTKYEGTSPSMVFSVDRKANELFGEQKTTQEMSRQELKANIDLFSRSSVDVKPFIVDYHIKLAMPFAGFVFTLVGAPLVLRSSRGGRFFGVAASVVITLLYYVAASLLRSLGFNGVIPPQLAAWFPNLAFATLGLVMLRLVR